METHWDRFCRLQQTRVAFCRRPHGERGPDVAGRIVHLDGQVMRDVPSFFLHIGEAIHGPGGYFGGGLYALGDCLCGGFGIKLPLTIMWSAPEAARSGLDHAARVMFHAATVHSLTLEPDIGEDRVSWIAEMGWLGGGREEEDLALWERIHEVASRGPSPDKATILQLSAGFYQADPGPWLDSALRVLREHGVQVRFLR